LAISSATESGKFANQVGSYTSDEDEAQEKSKVLMKDFSFLQFLGKRSTE